MATAQVNAHKEMHSPNFKVQGLLFWRYFIQHEIRSMPLCEICSQFPQLTLVGPF